MSRTTGSDDTPRRPLSRERILAEALLLADRQGNAGLTMRALARALGVEAMSLYNHIASKDDLIDGMVESVVASIALPAPRGDWQAEMRKRALSMRAAFLTHPWAAPLMVSRINIGPNMLSLIDATLGCLHAAGFDHATADHVWNALDSHIYGFHLLERSFPLQPGQYAEAARQFLPNLPPDRYPHMHTLALMVAKGRHTGTHDFEFGLDLLLTALATMRSG
ncbi:MAG: TetR/AcrR family transcriptional regulator C-terminal domain-containing protein [Rhodocyclales bacterium]|nr:TetR/AcrR family transcriptional regulator C-terminal domain-containing protein [Rhodocyclales bacterium]